MADDDWDLGAVVRSCGRRRATPALPPRCPFASFPRLNAPPEVAEEAVGGEGGAFLGFPDLLLSHDDGFGRELEELCKPFFSAKVHQQQFPTPTPRVARVGPSSIAPASAAPLAAASAAGPAHQPPPARQPHRPLSQMPRSKRRKNQQKKVVFHVPAAGISSDVWAWRKYGQKPIKGSPYPRGYYRCSSSKGCPARKQVERSRADPAMFIITYTAEHNHPAPTHRNSLAGSTRQKFPSSAPAAAGGSAENPSTNPPSSSTAAGLSPTTPLTASMEDELLHPRPQEGDDGEDEEMEDEGMLLVEDMEVMGEDDLLFTCVGDEAVVPDAGGAGSAVATPAEAAAFFGDDGGLGDHFFVPPWLSKSSNTAAAAGGG